MRIVCFVISCVLAGYPSGCLGLRAAGLSPETCQTPFRLGQKSFKRLDARNAYVWVDDIQSKFFGGYSPFQLSVVVGSASAPLRAESGRLERAAFDRLVNGAYGVRRMNTMVSDASLRGGAAAVSFTSADGAFALRVVSVKTSSGGEDAVMLKLCR